MGAPTGQEPSVADLQTSFKQLTIENQSFGPEAFQVQDQFLLSCSDDGTVRLYDFSQMNRGETSNDGKGEEHDDLKVRRSQRATQKSNQSDVYAEVPIFELELTPDGFRPGQRNKKLDTLCCTSTGLVLAGTNTGELFVWKVYFQEIQKRNNFNAAKFLGKCPRN